MSINWKIAVRASSFRNEPKRTGLVFMVSPDKRIELSPGDRIFLNKQHDLNENGVYVVGKYPNFFWKRSSDLSLNSDQYLAGILDDYNMKTWVQISKNVVGSSRTCWVPEEEYLEYCPKHKKVFVEKPKKPVPKYTGSLNTKTYHKSSCKFSKLIEDKYKILKDDPEYFQKQGYKQCKICMK